MKKWIKYLISSACIALFLFLMLPFITPPSLADLSADKARLPAAIPQIFTTNPLTELVGRLAHIFGRKTPFSRSALAANDSFQPGPQILWQNTHANAGIGLPASRVAEAL
ncbi:MAG: hypothetical protein MJ053_07180, partial [Elusimicrobiaceae bacterium]|nr:hypothetical protein [Elusimicrobiaceae bacterium]